LSFRTDDVKATTERSDPEDADDTNNTDDTVPAEMTQEESTVDLPADEQTPEVSDARTY